MGKIANRINRNRAVKQITAINLDAFAQAVKSVSMATASDALVDCQAIAYIARDAMLNLGLTPALTAGYAASRIDGSDAAAVVGHHPALRNSMYAETGDKPVLDGHCWLTLHDRILDFSTFQLPYKSKRLDAADGRHTAISWTPDYLLLDKTELLSLHKIINGFKTGTYYEEIPSVLDQLNRKPPIVHEAVESVIRIYMMMNDDSIDKVIVKSRLNERYRLAA